MCCNRSAGVRAALDHFADLTGVTITSNDWHQLRGLAEAKLGRRLTNSPADAAIAANVAAKFASAISEDPGRRRVILYDITSHSSTDGNIHTLEHIADSGLTDDMLARRRRMSAWQKSQIEALQVDTKKPLTISADERTLRAHLHSEDPRVLRDLAGHPNLPNSMARVLLREDDPTIVEALLYNIDTDEYIVHEVYERATEAGWGDVAREAREHRNFPAYLYEQGADDALYRSVAQATHVDREGRRAPMSEEQYEQWKKDAAAKTAARIARAEATRQARIAEAPRQRTLERAAASLRALHSKRTGISRFASQKQARDFAYGIVCQALGRSDKRNLSDLTAEELATVDAYARARIGGIERTPEQTESAMKGVIGSQLRAQNPKAS